MMIKKTQQKLLFSATNRSVFCLVFLCLHFSIFLSAKNNETNRISKTDSLFAENNAEVTEFFLQGNIMVYNSDYYGDTKSDDQNFDPKEKAIAIKKAEKLIITKTPKRQYSRVSKNDEKEITRSRPSGVLFSIQSFSKNLIIQGSSGTTLFAEVCRDDFDLHTNLAQSEKYIGLSCLTKSCSFSNVYHARPPPHSC